MKVKNEVKVTLNDLKMKLKNEFPLIRNLCRRKNTIHFFGGTYFFEGDMKGSVLGRVLGADQDLSPYTDFIDSLGIPNLSWERKEHYPGVPYILITLNS